MLGLEFNEQVYNIDQKRKTTAEKRRACTWIQYALLYIDHEDLKAQKILILCLNSLSYGEYIKSMKSSEKPILMSLKSMTHDHGHKKA